MSMQSMARPLPSPSFVPAHESARRMGGSYVHPPLPLPAPRMHTMRPRSEPKFVPPKNPTSWRSKTCIGCPPHASLDCSPYRCIGATAGDTEQQ
jgi:hypothetical protein